MNKPAKQTPRINPFRDRKILETGGRTPFMKRLREALGNTSAASPAPLEPPPPLDETLIRQCAGQPGSPALVDRWIERAKGNSMTVLRVADTAQSICTAIDQCLAKHTVRRILLNAGELGQRANLDAFAKYKNLEIVHWGEPACRDKVFTCEAAVTDCRAGLADAGSLLVWSDASFGRSSTLVVVVHIILLPAKKIVPDLVDGLALSRGPGGQLASNVVVINGPSKTADIEMNLITGVHGPKFVYVLIID